MTNFEMFNKVNGMTDAEVKDMYDADKASIVKFLFVEMKDEIIHTDVKDLFQTTVPTKKTRVKKELTDDERMKKTVRRKLSKEARTEIAELKDKGEKLTPDQETAIREQWLSRLDEEVKKMAKAKVKA